jgi:hypothetical protein
MTSKIKVDNITDQDDNNIINESGDVITVGASGDTVAVAGNIVKSNALQASDGGNIVNQSGTTITLGASGDTVTLASGASQTGFGRSGSVDWQTGSIKTGTFTAASGEGYFADTSSSAFTMNLPAGTAGAIVAVADYTRTFNTNNLTISPNGSQKIGGEAETVDLDVNGQALTLVYVDDTEGWINVQNAEDTETGINPFIEATGGTVTCSGDYKIHTFTGPGTFTVTKIACVAANNEVSHLVVAGGAGGGSCGGGGGGAGGFRESKSPVDSYTSSPIEGGTAVTVTAAAFPITVGAGGSGGCKPANLGGNGSNSVFSTITSAGGGGGGKFQSTFPGASVGATGQAGGSGGGSGGSAPTGVNPGGSGNSPPVSPAQGQPGGTGQHIGGCTMRSGGGGGATGAGGNGTNQSPGPGSSVGGTGGTGATTSITGSPLAYAGGGGGAGFENASGCGTSPCGTGGTGGGRAAAASSAGTTNRGGGGGGGAHPGGGVNGGSAGGSGIVIIRYKFQ